MDIFATHNINKIYAFAGVDKIFQQNFLPRLFFGKSRYFPSVKETLSTMQFKKASLGLQNPVTPYSEKFPSLQCVSMELIRDGTEKRKVSTANHLQAIKEEKNEGKNHGMTSMMPN